MRPLPDLLFVTDEKALDAHTRDPAGVAKLLGGLGQVLRVDAAGKSAAEVAGLVRAWLAKHPSTRGIVLVGGYGVLPAQRVGCVPPGLAGVSADQDLDRFIVWSDDVYGDLDGDHAPELPVSRVPDAGSLAFLERALAAPAAALGAPAFGLRSKLRPFADEVFARSAKGKMATSVPTTPASARPLWEGKGRAYLALHGLVDDPGRFLGEDDDGDTPDALATKNVPSLAGGVVFAACCWSALIVDTAAVDAKAGQKLVGRTPEKSIALRALASGANAFVGSTGLHYSPPQKLPKAQDPYGYLSKPLHQAFWDACAKGSPPARALFEAKAEYTKGIPHAVHSPLEIALECKILREFTCLGLGW
jgi:hypothetical protein